MSKTLMEILAPRRGAEQCKALVAQGKHHDGVIVECVYDCMLHWEIGEIGTSRLDDYGLDDAPPGISIWEGVAIWQPGGYECPQDGQFNYEGAFRKLNTDEAAKLAAGERLWPEPPEEDVDEDQRAEVQGDLSSVRDDLGSGR